eukprot:scaffold22207_cov56-Phaeocystis_antarctica.AAC.1
MAPPSRRASPYVRQMDRQSASQTISSIVYSTRVRPSMVRVAQARGALASYQVQPRFCINSCAAYCLLLTLYCWPGAPALLHQWLCARLSGAARADDQFGRPRLRPCVSLSVSAGGGSRPPPLSDRRSLHDIEYNDRVDLRASTDYDAHAQKRVASIMLQPSLLQIVALRLDLVGTDMVEAVETQEQLFTEADVSHMHEQVRALAQQWFADKKDEVDSEDSEDEEDELESWLGKLDSELQEISDLQERGNHLQRALKKLQEEVEDLRARNVEPPAEQVEALTLLRGASEVLRERWPEDKPPNEWKGVTFKEGQVSEISLVGCDELESLPPEVGGLLALTSLTLCMCKAVTELPAEVGGLRALTSLNLYGAGLTTLPAEVGGLRALTSLDLCRTDLTTLPAE